MSSILQSKIEKELYDFKQNFALISKKNRGMTDDSIEENIETYTQEV